MRTILPLVASMLILLVLYSAGCAYQSPYPNSAASYAPAQRTPQPPPEDSNNVKAVILVIDTDPPGAEIYAYENDRKTRLGTSPMDMRVSFCEHDGVVWFKDPPGWASPDWFRTGNNALSYYPFYIAGPSFYGVRVSTAIFGTPDGRYIATSKGNQLLTDGYRIRPLGFPVKLITHGRLFSQELAEAINSEDYYGAEELRLGRINELTSALNESQEVYNTLRTQQSAVAAGGRPFLDNVQARLIQSEIDQLTHTVGLLDPQLMTMRKQLLARLQAGDIDAAFALAQGVSAMERRYFPEPEQPPAIAQVQTPATQNNVVVQGQQVPARQEIIVQQKPYYGAANVVEALGAMRGSRLDPEAYQKALGGAQLLDIMGFGSMINK